MMQICKEHLANNPDLVIATPGRLMHHILEAELSLSRVEILVAWLGCWFHGIDGIEYEHSATCKNG